MPVRHTHPGGLVKLDGGGTLRSTSAAFCFTAGILVRRVPQAHGQIDIQVRRKVEALNPKSNSTPQMIRLRWVNLSEFPADLPEQATLKRLET